MSLLESYIFVPFGSLYNSSNRLFHLFNVYPSTLDAPFSGLDRVKHGIWVEEYDRGIVLSRKGRKAEVDPLILMTEVCCSSSRSKNLAAMETGQVLKYKAILE